MYDMATRARPIGLKKAVKDLRGKKLRVGTMCSGTDAPILALRRLLKFLRDEYHEEVQFDHVFSCEIEVDKAAFIRRNADISLIYRDVRQMAFGDKASTHYGAEHDIPTDLDVVIAGFSCVDFSSMNPNPKTLRELGESGDTFQAIRLFAKTNNPKFLILENVVNAPWKAAIRPAFQPTPDETGEDPFWHDHPGYAAVSGIFDTMDFYLPQSRNRGYMILINRLLIHDADSVVQRWFPLMQQLSKRASVSAEAIFLKADDPRLQHARDQIIRDGRSGARSNVVEWILSSARHDAYRKKWNLGNSRPILKWTEGGTCQPREHTWALWIKRQVQRIKDTIEINTLRNITRFGFDSEYKLRIWNLSQNIDRDLDKMSWGIVECLTPTGIYYNTLRGGPMVGMECLSLQGLPIDEMLLSRETDKELVNLAGNAMSSTVVAAAVLAGIICLSGHLGERITAEDRDTAAAAILSMWMGQLQTSKSLHLGQLQDSEKVRSNSQLVVKSETQSMKQLVTLEDLCEAADQTVQLCSCEGQSLTTKRRIRVCLACSFTSCSRCGGNPAHNYGNYGENYTSPRLNPEVFRSKLKQVLPMRLRLERINVDLLLKVACGSSPESLAKMVERAMDEELKFYSIKRSHCWMVVYKAPHSRLELVIHQRNAKWLFYVEPDRTEAGNSQIRQLFELPLARMQIEGENIRGGILQGQWELRQPIARKFDLRISRLESSRSVPAWESTLGLVDPNYIGRRVLDIFQIENLSAADDDGPASQLTGKFEHLPVCGTAFGNLYKRVSAGSEDSIFLFLDPARCGAPVDDGFVFSTDKHRLDYGERRNVIGILEASWRPSDAQESTVVCTVPATWIATSGILKYFDRTEPPTYAVLTERIDPLPNFLNHGCRNTCEAILSCTIPLETQDPDVWTRGVWQTISQTRQKPVLMEVLFALVRLQSLDGFSPEWRRLHDFDLLKVCQICAPAEPELRWESKTINKKAYKILPYEDADQALTYETAMLASPTPFLIQTRIDEHGQGCLRIGLNVPALLHGATANLATVSKLTMGAQFENMTARWRLVTDHGQHKTVNRGLHLVSNAREQLSPHVFYPYGQYNDPATRSVGEYQLREEQTQSLRWMVRREDPRLAAFVITETVEAILGQLGWRAEATVKQAKQVLGGICSDVVGYGKTAITIALIDSTIDRAIKFSAEACADRIALKATLIVVPTTLCAQWEQQIRKFTGQRYHVLVVTTTVKWLSLTVRELREADMIIVSWALFDRPSYTDATAYLGTVPPGPESGGRPFSSWFLYALEGVGNNVAYLKEQEQVGKLKTTAVKKLNRKLWGAQNDQNLINNLPLRREKGRKYTSGLVPLAEREEREQTRRAFAAKVFRNFANANRRHNPFDLLNADSLNDCKGLPFHAFEVYRLVLDEHTYVHDRVWQCVITLQAQRRWILSGTPPLATFSDLQESFGLIGVPLGIEDDNIASMSASAIRKFRKERTSAERFRAFDVTYSESWYQQRQLHAQSALHLMTRQNQIPVNIEIPSREIIVAITLTPVEKVIYKELQQELYANEMRIAKPGKTELNVENPKHLILRTCHSGEEALLRCASTFPYLGPDVEHTAKKTYQLPYKVAVVDETSQAVAEAILGQRKQRLAKFRLRVYMSMRKAFFLDQRIGGNGGADDEDGTKDQESDKSSDEESGEKIVEENVQENGRANAQKRAEEQEEENKKEKEEGDGSRQKKGNTKARGAKKGVNRDNNDGFNSDFWRNLYRSIRDDTRGDQEISQHLNALLTQAKDKGSEGDERIFFMTRGQRKRAKETLQHAKATDSKLWTKANSEARKRKRSRGDGNRIDYTVQAPVKLVEIRQAALKDALPRRGLPSRKALRTECAHLRKWMKRFVDEYMALRFLQAALDLQLWNNRRLFIPRLNTGAAPTIKDSEFQTRCSRCNEVIDDPEEIAVLGVCGHLACTNCLDNEDDELRCPKPDCIQSALSHYVHHASALATPISPKLRYGSKIDNVIDIIWTIPPDEQILIFIQFEALGQLLEVALEKEGIKFYSLLESEDARRKKAMDGFQNNSKPTDKEFRQILILDSSNESAAGANLVGANHVMFVSPLLAEDDHRFNQSYTQCVGRARRQGQTKTVNVYRFICLHTIDVDVYEERTKSRLISTIDMEQIGEGSLISVFGWQFKANHELVEGEAQVQFGAGYRSTDFMEEDD